MVQQIGRFLNVAGGASVEQEFGKLDVLSCRRSAQPGTFGKQSAVVMLSEWPVGSYIGVAQVLQRSGLLRARPLI